MTFPGYNWNMTSNRASKLLLNHITLSCVRVTVDEFWIDDRIYWTLWYRAWLHITIFCYRYTSVHSHIFTAVVWYQLTTADIPLLLGPWTVPACISLLLTATAHDWTTAVLFLTGLTAPNLGCCLVTTGCCDSTVLTLSKYASLLPT
jgi:hypothetical protein